MLSTCQSKFFLTAHTAILLGFLGRDRVLIIFNRVRSFPGTELRFLNPVTGTRGRGWGQFFTIYNVSTGLQDWFWQSGRFLQVWCCGWGRGGGCWRCRRSALRARSTGSTGTWCWRSLGWWGSSWRTAWLCLFLDFLFKTDRAESLFIRRTKEPTAVAAEWWECLLRVGVHVLSTHLTVSGPSPLLSQLVSSHLQAQSRNSLTDQLSCSCKANISDWF